MNTTDIERILFEKVSIDTSNLIERDYVPKQSLCEYLKTIDKESLFNEVVSEVYLDYVRFCDKQNLKPTTANIFSKIMIQCGFKIKPMKKNKKAVRCFYY